MRSFDDYQRTILVPFTLTAAAKNGDLDAIERQLRAGAPINARDTRGYSALMLAGYSSQFEALKLLVARGAEIESPDFAGNTALMAVAFKGDLPALRFLLEAGADPDRQNIAGMTAADFAKTFGRKEIAVFLQNRRAAASGGRLKNFIRLFMLRLKFRRAR